MDNKPINTDISSRKNDHIDLALSAHIEAAAGDKRFYYEPILSGMNVEQDLSRTFLGKSMKYPVWISSMTGGALQAKKINHNLAKLCAEFELGMGLGSCRVLLDSEERLSDFDLRSILGRARPFYGNIGIAQVEELIRNNELGKLGDLKLKLDLDGIIIHVNPLQEWAQVEGDRIHLPPIDTIAQCLDAIDFPIIVKEVGQGMGPKSIQLLMSLPLEAIEFGAFGGTNFTRIELERADDERHQQPFTQIGHTAEEMVGYVNQFLPMPETKCRQFIISGGVKNYLHGHYLINTCGGVAIYGQASALLKYAVKSYGELKSYFQYQMEGLTMAHQYLHIKAD